MNKKLEDALKIAKEAVDKEPNSRLILEHRKKIISAFGPRANKVDGEIEITKPLIKRVKLASLCAERVLPIWEEVYSDEYDIKKVVAYAWEFIDGLRDRKRCREVINDFNGYLVDLEGGPIQPYAAGRCAVRVLVAALNDEKLEVGDTAFEEDREFDKWDASFAGSVAVSGLYWYEDDNSKKAIEKRKEYWDWYLNEAVLLADRE